MQKDEFEKMMDEFGFFRYEDRIYALTESIESNIRAYIKGGKELGEVSMCRAIDEQSNEFEVIWASSDITQEMSQAMTQVNKLGQKKEFSKPWIINQIDN
ncbi:MAG: hypothetical protein CVV46_05975 [Spirochaetae bacterium HGW-Spirochaetae-2]|nr:MAG: hypothetical protein CVV46_05975 [Spirochaetae bacterium HGW-Spirochaetae-2]